MMEYPVTPGYTINIVKDKTKSAIILLTPSMNNPNVKILRPSNSDISLEERNVPDPLHHDKQRNIITRDVAVPENVTKKEDLVDVKTVASDQLVFYEEVVTDNTEVGFFADVSHEEIVVDSDVQSSSSSSSLNKPTTSKKKKDSETAVQCDICNTLLPSRDSAREHMKVAHDILSYEGPFIKCDFCGIFVTDRVSHMKSVHYSSLSQAFIKRDNCYHCLQCQYMSDQLTNIRNHVDAKHGDGENKYECEDCHTVYKTLNSMRAHKSRVHTKRKKLLEGYQLQNSKKSKIDHGTKSTNKEQKLQEEILELELKTLPTFVNRVNDINKFIV